MNNKPKSLEQACCYLQNKRLGDVETAGEHDVGIDVKGTCYFTQKPCTNFIPDFPYDFKYNFLECNIYLKRIGED